MAKFGPESTVSATATDRYAPHPKPIRQQPQGLRTRFTPIGVPVATPPQTITNTTKTAHNTAVFKKPSSSSDSASESDSDSDEEMINAPASSGVTSSLSQKSATKPTEDLNLKRKHVGDGDATPNGKDLKATEKSTTKRHKSNKSVSASADTAKASSKPISAKKETPVAAPELSQVSSSASTTSATPSKSKKDKSDKKSKVLEKKARTTQTPIPPPQPFGMKR
jgi:hypothetical protein